VKTKVKAHRMSDSVLDNTKCCKHYNFFDVYDLSVCCC